MSSANLLVLNMLGQGRISTKEAELLLRGLSERAVGAVASSVTGKANRKGQIDPPVVLPTYFSGSQPAWI
jgi:hypothetical protein